MIEKVDNKHHETYWPQLTWNELDCFVNSKLWKSAFIELALCNRPHKKYWSKHEENQPVRSRQTAASLLETGDEDDGKQPGNKLTGRNKGNVNTDEMKQYKLRKPFSDITSGTSPFLHWLFQSSVAKVICSGCEKSFLTKYNNLLPSFLSFFLSFCVCLCYKNSNNSLRKNGTTSKIHSNSLNNFPTMTVLTCYLGFQNL